MSEVFKHLLERKIGDTIAGKITGSGKIRTHSGKEYYLKTGSPSRTYRCEANGLRELAKAASIDVANVVSVGEDYILTDFINLGKPMQGFYREFGRRFARLHRHHGRKYGFVEDNFIGINPQQNIPSGNEANNWSAFFFNKRLLYQYKLAERNGFVSNDLRSGFLYLEKIIEELLKYSIEPPTLLHGDLWSGNYIRNDQGGATLIDPAVYYGHREADLAMTKVFGGFPPEFYKGYMDEYPLPENWEEREGVYKLYHILNHLNIFGRSYLAEAEYLVSKDSLPLY